MVKKKRHQGIILPELPKVTITKDGAIAPALKFDCTKSGASFLIDMEDDEAFTITLGIFMDVGFENKTFKENIEEMRSQYQYGVDEADLLQKVTEVFNLVPCYTEDQVYSDDHNWQLTFNEGSDSYKKIKELYNKI